MSSLKRIAFRERALIKPSESARGKLCRKDAPQEIRSASVVHLGDGMGLPFG
jgi:hypothetical protein